MTSSKVTHDVIKGESGQTLAYPFFKTRTKHRRLKGEQKGREMCARAHGRVRARARVHMCM